MIYVKPSFYDKFRCIASQCKDNCCIGWEVDVDDVSYEKYRSVSGDFGQLLMDKIDVSPEGDRCFRLGEHDRCPFLNKDNLCDIFINCGEEYLCDICREHPRFYEWFPGVTECGLGLSCEEVCRILLSDDEMLKLTEYNDGEEIILDTPDDLAESDTYIFLSSLREHFFDILRNDDTLEDKLAKILSLTERFVNDDIKLRDYKESIALYMKTEPIDDKWTQYINDMNDILPEILLREKDFQQQAGGDKLYSKILAYIIYRHFLKSVFDGGIAERVCFCVESIRFIRLCDMKTFCKNGCLAIEDRVENLKNWSKQVEYSEENTDLLIYGEEDT
jgi:lysine-N-methylase